MAYARFKWKKGVRKHSRPLAPRDGSWYVGYKNKAGEDEQEACAARMRTEAEKLAEELEFRAERIRKGVENEPLPDITVAEVFEKQFALVYSKQADAKNVNIRFRRHILPTLGNTALRLVTPADIDALLDERGKDELDDAGKLRREGLMPGTLKHLRVHLHSLFEYAINSMKAFRGENPVKEAQPIKLPEREPVVVPEDLLERALGATVGLDRFLLKFAVLTGIRKGELINVEWPDVDEEAGIIWVRKSLDRDTTKGGKIRYVPIHADLLPDIQYWRQKATSKYLFPGKDGGRRTKTFNAVRKLRKAMKAGGVTGPEATAYVFKDLRSTFGTLAVEATDGDIKFVQDVLGHADDRVTRKHYLRSRAKHFQAQMNRLKLSVSVSDPALESVIHSENCPQEGNLEAAETTQETASRPAGFEPAAFGFVVRSAVEINGRKRTPTDATGENHTLAGAAVSSEDKPTGASEHQQTQTVAVANLERPKRAVDNLQRAVENAEATGPQKFTATLRFWAKVQLGAEDKCWGWMGPKDGAGRPLLRVGGSLHYAHLVAWALEHGPVPVDRVLHHRCGNIGCVRAGHLALALPEAFSRTGKALHKRAARGGRHGRAKLTETQVEEIRQEWTQGSGKRQLARAFGVSPKLIREILAGRVWSHTAPMAAGGMQ